ncbi:MAG: TIGR03067 domain-containing protein [Gemmataceae bacterium]
MMVRYLTLAACLALPLFAQEPDPTPPDGKRIQGKWQIVKGMKEGAPAPKDMLESKMTIDGVAIQVTGARSEEPPAAYTLDPKKKPAEIDITPGRGTDQKVLGIYKFEKDELTLVFNKPGEGRPKAFDEKAASVIVLRREKK